MKKIVFVFFLSLLFISCEKEEKLPPNPEWLNTMISQLEDSPTPGIVVYAYKWKEDYYYNISNPISSCMFCELYDFQGDKQTWTDDVFSDFASNSRLIKAVWRKGF
jgi:hypothetical protein